MSATAREQTGAPMNETIDYGSGPDRPAGSPTMPIASPQTPHRYTYGSGSRPLDGYTIKRAIGRGGFGEVYYATSDSGKEVALKLITRNVEVERRGVAQCMNLKCPNLLTIFDIRTNDAGETFVVMEYVAGPSLAGVLEKYPDGMPVHEIRAWMKGLVDGVDYLHDHGIVHRDLKPANLFLEEGMVKIGDYGLAKIVSLQGGSDHSESIGTCHYMAPEISTGKYHKPIDVYAIGVILFEMLTGRVPFEGETVGEVLMKHLTTRPDLSPLAEPYRTIVGQALAKDPANRPKRAHDLLLPDDAPRARDLRFIGEGKAAPPADPGPAKPWGGWAWEKVKARINNPRPANAAKAGPPPAQAATDHTAAEDEVLRIGEQEPVFYIGPDTRPPAAARSIPRRRPYTPTIRWVGDVIRSVPIPRPARPVVPAYAPRPRAARPATPPPAPPSPAPPPSAPARPSGRARLGELAWSMFASAIVVGVLAWPGALALGLDPASHPEVLSYLVGMTLLGTWGAVVPSKLFEGSAASPTVRRLVGLGVGTGLGLFGAWAVDWLKIPLTSASNAPLYHELGVVTAFGPEHLALNFATYFGLAYFLNGWWKVADRDRKGQILLLPVTGSALIAAALTPLFPYREAWIGAVVPAVALATQVVSPWSRQAAAYAAYTRAEARARAKVKAA